MHRPCHIGFGVVVAVLLVCPAGAAVTDSSASGFTLTESFQTSAPPAKVYGELIRPAHWWSAEHSYSHDAANFTLDARAGGCWCEKLPDGGSVQHMTVVMAMPGKMLRLRGALGPFQALGVDGALTFVLTPTADGGTAVKATYALGGYYKDGFANLAAAGDGVLAEQFARLKSDIETGSPEAKH
ncbi:MAG TPA: hypothetical protein VII56_20520 [Rhizomicrobium sp.]